MGWESYRGVVRGDATGSIGHTWHGSDLQQKTSDFSLEYFKTQFRLEANDPTLRGVVNLRCYLLSLLRIHRSDCEHCIARENYGVEMRKRLEELNWRTQPHSLNNGDYVEPVEVIRTPISLKAQRRKAG